MDSWEKAEQRVAKLFGGKLVRGSGRGTHKGDVVTDNYLIEVKETAKQHYTLSFNTLLKLVEEAWAVRKVPLLIIELGDGQLYVVHEITNQQDSTVVSVRLPRKTNSKATLRYYSFKCSKWEDWRE